MPSITKKILSNCDVFGSPIGLNFEKGNIYRTTFGAVISVVFAVFMGLFFWNTISQFIAKDIVKVAMSKTYSTNPSKIQINPQGLMFAVKVDSPDFINRPIFNITFEKRDYVNHPDGSLDRNRYPMYLEPCTLDHWTQLPSYNINWTDQFIKANLSSYLCPRKQDIIEIEGIFSSEHFKHAKIGITDCKNNTPESNPWRPVCASPQFIKSYFDTNKNVRVVMQVVNYIINPPDPSNYITSFLDNQLFFTVNPQSYQTADIYFNEYEFITDNSIMPYKSIESKKLPVLENGNFRAQQFLYTQTSYGDFFFRRDPVTYTLNRQFQKVSEVISYIGGFSQIFLSIAAVIVCFYNDYIYSVRLANKLYNFEFQDTGSHNQERIRQQVISQNALTYESSPQLKKKLNSSNQQQINVRPYQIPIEKARPSLQYQQKSNESLRGNNFISTHQKPISEQSINKSQINNILKNGSIQFNEQDLPSKQIISSSDKAHNNISAQNKKGSFSNNQNIEVIQNDNNFNQEQSQVLYIPDEGNEVCEHKKYDMSQVFIKELNLKKLSPSKQDQLTKQYSFQEDILNVDLKKQQKTENIIQSKSENQYISEINSPASEQNIKILLFSGSKSERQMMYYTDKQDNVIEKENSQIFQQDQLNINKVNLCNQNDQQDRNLSIENNIFKQVPIMSENNLYQIQQVDQGIYSAPKLKSSQNILNRQAQTSLFKNQVKQVIEDTPKLTNRQSYLKNKFTQFLKREENLVMTYKFFIYKLTCKKLCKTKQVMLVEKAHKLIRKDLDISSILYKLKELEKFKKLFLNEQQEILFNFFPKPIISSDIQKELPSRLNIQGTQSDQKKYLKNIIHSIAKSKFKKKVQKNFNVNEKVAAKVIFAVQKLKQPLKNSNQIFQYDQMSAYQTLYQAYISILRKKDITEIDKKLIVLLGQEMNGIFEDSEKIIEKPIMISNSRLLHLNTEDKISKNDINLTQKIIK